MSSKKSENVVRLDRLTTVSLDWDGFYRYGIYARCTLGNDKKRGVRLVRWNDDEVLEEELPIWLIFDLTNGSACYENNNNYVWVYLSENAARDRRETHRIYKKYARLSRVYKYRVVKRT